VGDGVNVGSYSNTQVDDLLEQAHTMQNCDDLRLRGAYYQDVQTLLAQDLAYLPLFAPYNLSAVGAGVVRGYEPITYRPQWNVDTWVVNDAGGAS
jgi:ABC-type transport system substrate-binding protein